MPDPVFLDKSKQPTDKELKSTLGNSYHLWFELKSFIAENIGDTSQEWKFYMAKVGWQLKTLLKKRNLFFFTPYPNSFKMTFVFGDKAVAEVEKSSLPKSVIDQLVNAKKYMEGRGISFDINSPNDLEVVKKLLMIKVNN